MMWSKVQSLSWSMMAVLLTLCLAGRAVYSQEPVATSVIHLQAGQFDPLAADSPVQAAQNTDPAALTADGAAYYLVQFSGPVEPLWVQQVAALGGRVLGYIPDHTHVVRAQPRDAAKISRLPAVRWVGAYLPHYKLAPDVQARSASADATQKGQFYLAAFPGAVQAGLIEFLETHGATIEQQVEASAGALLRIAAPLAALAAISQYPEVSWLEAYEMPMVTNAEGRKIMGAEAVWQDLGFYGAGQIVAVSDSGLSVDSQLSADFAGRLVRAFAPSEMNVAPSCRAKTNVTDLHGHGTHVAGSVLGNGSRSGSNAANHQYTSSHAGVAPEARLVFMALNTDGSSGIQCIDLNGDFIARGYDQGARISTNSWGGNDRGAYNVLSSVVDDYIWHHKDYLVLYAAGNAGPGQQTIGSPGTAKNVLTVGASENNRPEKDQESDNPDTVTDFSSRGPTADGRVKPEVVAPGSWILSVKAAQAPIGNFWGPFNNDYAFMGGTSMATPLTAGGAALVREWLGKARNISNPSGALMKAILINGAVQLPGQATPSIHSGYGRVDLKNTLNAHYAIIDDHLQGLQTGDTVSYTVQVVSSTVGALVHVANSPLSMDAVQAAAVTMQIEDQVVASASAAPPMQGAGGLSAQPLVGDQNNTRHITPLISGNGVRKAGRTPLANPVPPLAPSAAPTNLQSAGFRPATAASHPQTNSFLQHMVGGGDFEEPDWSNYWSEVWLGTGIPERTSNPSLVINGQYSVWLGGTESEDAIWYPLAFPDQIDTSQPSFIEFNVHIFDQDPGADLFCVALVDASGFFIGPYAPDQPVCVGEDGSYTYSHEFTANELADLAGESGYLVLYNLGDAVEPHLSAIVDDIVLVVDFPDLTLESTPEAGPPGTTFLLVSQYNVPYGPIDICVKPCSQQNYIKTVYADDQGAMTAFLYSQPTIAAGAYSIEIVNVGGRRAETTITIVAGGEASLSVSPTSAPAGSQFAFSGSGFIPNEDEIAVTINGQAFGTVGSDANGSIDFTISTQSNTPPGEYTVTATDSVNSSASVTFEVTALSGVDPSLVVTPTSGPPGSSFVFQAQNFTPNQNTTVALDGQVLGQVESNEAGELQLTLETSADVAPGVHTLTLSQGNKEASAKFEITSGGGGGGGGDAPSGGGLYITLVWTDPPAQAAANKTLINDLDLTVNGPGGQRFGNGNSPDRKNNVEVIRLEEPTAGQYIVTVTAQDVNSTFGAQPFALVVTSKQNFGATGNNVTLSTPSGGALKIYLPSVRR